MSSSVFVLALSAGFFPTDTATLVESIHRFDTVSGAYAGTERTWFAPDGRRLRQEVQDSAGNSTLLFVVLHDANGRESGAFYIEEGSESVSKELFTYSADGREKTTTYVRPDGGPGERTVSEMGPSWREVRKRYYRADSSWYGDEDVLWDKDGRPVGWDFRRVDREGGASFRYQYEESDADVRWKQRLFLRDGVPMRWESRSRISMGGENGEPHPLPFLPGTISTTQSETSPSFSTDGETLVFARYAEDWDHKEPYLGVLEEDGWRVESLPHLGEVYNLAIAPDGGSIVFSVTVDEGPKHLFRSRRTEDGWSQPENLTAGYGHRGSYPALTEEGHLLFYQAEGPAGEGIYLARMDGDGFLPSVPLYTPEEGTTFDAYAPGLSGVLFVSRCLDDACESRGPNGIWKVEMADGMAGRGEKIQGLPYAWGFQIVEPLNILVFTDGEDILTVPLSSVELDFADAGGFGRSDLFDPLLGSWEGELEYLDYGDNKTLVTLPTLLEILPYEQGKGLLLKFSYGEPDGRTVSSEERLFETEDGVFLGDAWAVTERRVDRNGGLLHLGLTRQGEDNGREATIRNTVSLEGDNLTITNRVQYSGAEEVVQRHQYRLRRSR